MGLTLILTDDPARGERLARNLCRDRNFSVHDLYGDVPVPVGSRLIVGDVSSATSESVLRLRRALEASRGADIPYLHLIHGNVGRGEAQATALGATRALPASIATAMLLNTVAALDGSDAVRSPAAAQVGAMEAREAFIAIFRAPSPPALTIVEAGTAIVNRAIRETNIRDWLAVVARFDDVTHRHCLSVAGLAAAFARTLGLSDADAHRLTKGALLHDIGKARIALAILNKPGPLTPEERREIERHPGFGHAMLQGGAYDPTTLAVVRSHHEMLDGTGYPDGLRSHQIPDLVRLVTICDIFAALIEWRPYKAPKSAEQAFGILRAMGPKLDGDLLRAFAPVVTACMEPARRATA